MESSRKNSHISDSDADFRKETVSARTPISEKLMSTSKGASAPETPFDAITLAKKHRISVDDAKAIIEQFGSDRKAVDKAARRIAA